MPAEMSFAQALTEARQIIVQQSNRIKSDLEKIKQLQETVAQQVALIGDHERVIGEQQDRVNMLEEQVRIANENVEQATAAREQAEQMVDRQGLRMSQLQEAMLDVQQDRDEKAKQIEQMTAEAEAMKNQIPTSEDEEALAALSSLLSTKKISVPAIGKNGPVIKMSESPMAEAA